VNVSRESSLERRRPRRIARPRLLIVCGSERTEPQYLTGLRNALDNLAVSNPCFELWLLLHHEDCRVSLPDCRATSARLRKHLPSFDKTRLDFANFAKKVPDAIDRAKALDPMATNHLQNPSTSVWRLVEKIMG
jgi:hypothetical protein